jgi:hypothetical protein
LCFVISANFILFFAADKSLKLTHRITGIRSDRGGREKLNLISMCSGVERNHFEVDRKIDMKKEILEINFLASSIFLVCFGN